MFRMGLELRATSLQLVLGLELDLELEPATVLVLELELAAPLPSWCSPPESPPMLCVELAARVEDMFV